MRCTHCTHLLEHVHDVALLLLVVVQDLQKRLVRRLVRLVGEALLDRRHVVLRLLELHRRAIPPRTARTPTTATATANPLRRPPTPCRRAAGARAHPRRAGGRGPTHAWMGLPGGGGGHGGGQRGGVRSVAGGGGRGGGGSGGRLACVALAVLPLQLVELVEVDLVPLGQEGVEALRDV
jgi:uncharacterized membrane protein YgcG